MLNICLGNDYLTARSPFEVKNFTVIENSGALILIVQILNLGPIGEYTSMHILCLVFQNY